MFLEIFTFAHLCNFDFDTKLAAYTEGRYPEQPATMFPGRLSW